MRSRTITAAGLVAVTALLATLGAGEEDSRPGLAVLPAENRVQSQWWGESGARAGQEILVSRLVEAGEFRVLDLPSFDAVIQERALWLPAGELTPAGAVKLSRELGVDYLVAGALTEYGTGRDGRKGSGGRRLMGLRAPRDFAVAFDLRLIDGETGGILWAEGERDEREPDTEVAAVGEIEDHDEDAGMFEEVLRPMIESLADRLVTRGDSP